MDGRVFRGRDPHTGKRRYLNKTTHGTKKDVQRYLKGVLRDIDLGVFVEPSQMSVSEYLDKWLETSARRRLRENSFAAGASAIRTGWRTVVAPS